VVPVPQITNLDENGVVTILWNVVMKPYFPLIEVENPFLDTSNENLKGRLLNANQPMLKLTLLGDYNSVPEDIQVNSTEIIYYFERDMKIQIEFANPEFLSFGQNQDQITISFTNTSQFKSIENIEMESYA
jgi:hypothetical protein